MKETRVEKQEPKESTDRRPYMKMMGMGSASFALQKTKQPAHREVFNSPCVEQSVRRFD